MRTYDILCKVHVTAHTEAEQSKATRLVGLLLGCGNLATRTGYWPTYPEGEEQDHIYQHWCSSEDIDIGNKFARLCRYLVWLRIALRQDTILFEILSPFGNIAILIEKGDKWERVYADICTLVDRGEYLANYFDNLK
jgi:hypothetical protein